MTDSVSPATHLIIKGARVHNLKNLDLVLPKNKFIVFTGLSGSGKSSLAFDTIYAEGQRRYVESLSSYARQFLGIMPKPDVDTIDGLSPAISIDQKTTSHNPRSTVGTITEIYDYLRLLYARIGRPSCPACGHDIVPQTIDQIGQSIETLIQDSTLTGVSRWLILSPIVQDKKGEFAALFANLRRQGFSRIRLDGGIYHLDEDLLLLKNNRHRIDVVIDRLTWEKTSARNRLKSGQLGQRLRRSLASALELSQGQVILCQVLDSHLTFPDKPKHLKDHRFSQKLACPQCGFQFPPLEPRLFSFNTPQGACPTCTGLGSLLKIDPNKIIASDLTLSEGAIIPLAQALSTDSWYRHKLDAVVSSYHHNLTTPYSQLPFQLRQHLLYGSPRWYQAENRNRQGQTNLYSFQWEGIVNELERRFKETQSEFMRSEITRFMKKETCPDCQGFRLKPEALSVRIKGLNLGELSALSVDRFTNFIQSLKNQTLSPASSVMTVSEQTVAAHLLKEIGSRTDFLVSVGLNYLTLNREAGTLAGGEAQRIRLASQIGTGLTGVLYVLDEPTIGLHSRDNDRLIQTLIKLRDLGNTVIVVEHDREVILSADLVIDFGPGAGLHGGTLVAQGSPQIVAASDSLTGRYLSHRLQVNASSLALTGRRLNPILKTPRLSGSVPDQPLVLHQAQTHNLQSVDAVFPLGRLIVVTGVSGSGKSSLVTETLYPAIRHGLGLNTDNLGQYNSLTGLDPVTKVLLIDQSPIGRTPRSNPATYTKTFDSIRELFASTKAAQALNFKPGRFSFNVKGGRCEACQGGGQVKIVMQFLADLYVTCEVCRGYRYNTDTLSVTYQGKNIAQVLDLTIDEALAFFPRFHKLQQQLATLKAVGLGYLKLGQPAPTLSGGEAQRVKLARELSVSASGHTVYVLDEPTTGLHFEDVKHLLVVLKRLVANRNTVIVIEHNLDVIKNADWLIDLGPDGGEQGGRILFQGLPKDLTAATDSHTARYLTKSP